VIRYFLKSLATHFGDGRSLFALSVLGVALGVASVLSIQIINRNALGAFEGSMRAISGDADFSILGRTPTIPETLYPQVLADPGVAGAWPLYRLDVALAGRDEIYLQILGLDLFAPMQIPWRETPDTTASPLWNPGWAAVSPELATRQGWDVGDFFEVTSGSTRTTLQVGALVDFRSTSPLANSRMVVMDIAQAQSAFGGRGLIHQIDVQVREGSDLERVKGRLSRALGPAVQILTPEQRRHQASGLLGAFRLNLTALSLVSLFVGGFLIYSSTQASLVRRRNEFGLLRSVGTTRGQVLGLILGEVALLGAIGVLLGLPLGYGVASLSVERVSGTLTNLYLLEEIETLQLPTWLYAMAAAIGVGGAVGGALLPALEVSRRDARSLLLAYTLQERSGAGAFRLFLIGCLVLLLGLSGYFAFARDWRPGGFALGVTLLIGLPLMTPWVVKQVTRAMTTRGFGLRYGMKALGLRLQTTSFAVAALAVAVSLLIGITLMIGSFRRTVEIWINATVNADVYITTESWGRAHSAAALDEALVHELGTLPGVAQMDRLRQLRVYSGDRRISLAGVDMSLSADLGQFELIEGDLASALRRCREEGAVIISEPLARKGGLGVGSTLLVTGPDGEVEFGIAGISYDYSNEAGAAATDLGTLERAFGPGPINNIGLYLEDGVDPQEFVDGLKGRYADLPLVIRSERSLREEVLRVFDQTFAVTRLLQAISLLIAVCGVALTLIVLARERISELALYRALGARRIQIFRVFLGKGLGIALFGLAMGTGGGLALALILILLINRAYFGWTIAFHWPWGALAEQALTIVTASVLASLYPALRASRTPATELSRENL
jgi:putative ABC transport system permease protein